MSTVRKIQAPGIELNEVDRSQYDQTSDNSIVGTTSLIMGFSDEGRDYDVNYINSLNTFEFYYGKPKNEAERYFYNGAYEILNRGGRLYCAKLPYSNNSLDKFPYCTYTIEQNNLIPLSSPYEIANSIIITDTAEMMSVSMFDFMLKPDIPYAVLSNIYTEADELFTDEDIMDMYYEDTDYVSFCTFYDKYKIELTAIGDLFDYVLENLNVAYYVNDLIEDVFKTNGTIKSRAVYMLQELEDNKELFKSTYITESYSEEKREKLNWQADEFYDQIEKYGGVEYLIENYGKKLSLVYFKTYRENLESKITNLSVTTDDEVIKSAIVTTLSSFNDVEKLSKKYSHIRQFTDIAKNYIEIHSNDNISSNSGLMSIEELDKFLVKEGKLLSGEIKIVDISRIKYTMDNLHNEKREYIGIVPIMTTAANALYYQKIIDCPEEDSEQYLTLSSIQNVYSKNANNTLLKNLNNEKNIVDSNKIVGFTQNFGSESTVTEGEETVSDIANSFFPKFVFNDGITQNTDMRKIGVVVFKMYIDQSSSNRVGLQPVESFIGDLYKNQIDKDTNSNIFIDNIINTSSKYIRFFSNANNNENILKSDIFVIRGQQSTSFGLYQDDTKKIISVKESIKDPMTKILDNLKDPNQHRIDIFIDAGVSNIAQYISQVYKKEKTGEYEFDGPYSYLFNMNDSDCMNEWKNIVTKYDNFCKYTRKDCMFIADGLRSICLEGNEKRVRNTKPDNTIDNTVLKDIRKISGFINSSYGAGYCNWFRCIDQSSGDYFWCPPSIKAAGIYTYTDAYSNYWNAPAGMNRGKLPSDVIDCAFSPTIDEAGIIYNNNWNYAVNYPIDGIVMEGQRTYQKNRTALDRINVRRLCLGIEKVVKYIAKYFNYEQNTAWLRSRFKDSISNYLEEVKTGDGISDYVVIVDDRNNTVQTIENNELHCTIGVKPIKSVEFIVCNFVLTNQSANVTEIAESEM